MADDKTPAKNVDGSVDEILLGDGFSVVDSTATKNNSTAPKKGGGGDSNEKTVKKSPVKADPKKETPEEKKAEGKEDAKSAEETKKEQSEGDSTKAKVEEEDESKVNGHIEAKGDALLITTEEDLDLNPSEKKADETKKDGEEKEAEPKSESKEGENDKKERSKRKENGDVWASNISRHVKATDLKRHFSKLGKVLTAKIVTNGKSFFGYILMETPEIAQTCVRRLQATLLDGRKISLSRQRPDSNRRGANDRKRASTKTTKVSEKKLPSEKKDGDKEADKDKKSEKAGSEKIEKTPLEKKDDEIRVLKRKEDILKREMDYFRRETGRLKRFLSDEQRKLRTEQNKSRTLGRELQDVEVKLKDERRKFDREREMYEKNARTDRTRLEQDRSMIKKELEEVKKLREYLKRKIDEDNVRNLERDRRPRASSPYAYSSKRFREDDKSSKYMDDRTRTPPSPPKLSTSSRSKRSPLGAPQAYDRRYDHMDDGFEKDVRHGGSSMVNAKPAAPAPPRNIWPSAFHQDVWRMPPGGGNSAPNSGFSSGQMGPGSRQSDYGSKGPGNAPGGGYSNARERYGGSTIRKY